MYVVDFMKVVRMFRDNLFWSFRRVFTHIKLRIFKLLILHYLQIFFVGDGTVLKYSFTRNTEFKPGSQVDFWH